MRVHSLALACVLAAASLQATQAQPAGTAPPSAPISSPTLTLAEAVRQAQAANPAVRAREAQLAASDGYRREAQALLFNNPELAVEGTRRRFQSPDGSANEWNAGVAQAFETGGQQARRREAATAAQAALQAEIADARRQAGSEAAQRFYAVLAAMRRIHIEQRAVELFEGSAQAVEKRRAAGEDTRLDANVAQLEAERARNALGVARERLLDARAELGSTLQLPPAALPEVTGKLDAPQGAALPYDLARLLNSAQGQPKLRALTGREDAARARVAVERAARYPDVKLGLFVGREGAGDTRENITTLALSLPLPLFKQNDAAIGQALTDATQAEVERAAALRDTEARVRRLWLRLDSQRERVQRLQRTMAAADNRQLTAKSRQAGQIGLLDQLLVDRQTLDAERELDEALAEYHATRIELEDAAGWPLEGSTQ
jgi:cobalt-zinc-cadmium efflux system outer membrane protein